MLIFKKNFFFLAKLNKNLMWKPWVPQFLLPGALCLAFNKKSQAMLRGNEKTQSRESYSFLVGQLRIIKTQDFISLYFFPDACSLTW